MSACNKRTIFDESAIEACKVRHFSYSRKLKQRAHFRLRIYPLTMQTAQRKPSNLSASPQPERTKNASKAAMEPTFNKNYEL